MDKPEEQLVSGTAFLRQRSAVPPPLDPESERSERALRANEKLLNRILDSLRDAVFIIDVATVKIVNCNSAASEIFGYSRDEMLGRPVAFLHVDEKGFDEFRQHLYRAVEERGFLHQFEYRMKRKDGTIFPTEHSVTLLEDDRGHPTAWIGVVRDITERVRVEDTRLHQKGAEARAEAAEAAQRELEIEIAERRHIEQELRRRDAILEAVEFAAECFLQVASWEQSIQEVLARFGRATSASRVYILQNHLGLGGELLTSQRYERVAPGTVQIEPPSMQNVSYRTAGLARWADFLGAGRPIHGLVRDLPPGEQAFLSARAIRSIVVMPIFVGRQWWGAIGFDECVMERACTAGEIEALKTAASILGSAIQRQQAEEALNRRATQLALINDIGQKIASALDLDEVLSRAARLVQQSFGYHHVALFIVDRQKNELIMTARAGDFAHLFPSKHRMKLGQGMVGWVGYHGERLLANDVYIEPHYVNFYPDVVTTLSELSVPVRVGQETIGVLDVQSPHFNAFDENDVTVIETLADQIAVAIANARLYETVQRELAERTRAEKALEAERRRLFALLEELPAWVYLEAPDHSIRFANRSFREHFGEPMGLPCYKVLWGRDEPDEECASSRVFYAQIPQEWEWDQSPDGRIYQRYSYPFTDIDGSPLALELGIDITERKQIEEALRRRNVELLALNAIATTISQSFDLDQILNTTLDTVLEVIGIDAAWIQLLDQDQETSFLTLEAYRGLSQEMVQEVTLINLGEGITGKAAQSGQPIVVDRASEDPRVSKETVRREELRAFAAIPIRSKDKVLGVLGVFNRGPRKVSTQEVQLLTVVGHQLGAAIENVQLAEKTAEIEVLRELDRLRSELIANVSHELRNPLGLVKIHCTTLLREDVDFERETQREFLRNIREETDKLEEMVNNLLDSSRLQSGQLWLDKHPTDIGQIASKVMKSLEIQLTPRHHLVHDFPPGPLVASVDPKRIEEVLRNLLNNAIKYSPEGGTITIRGRRDKKQLLIQVSDQGIGIAPEELERVFERFYRARHATVKKVSGVGLGLPVCRGIVEAHGGRIWAESTPGVGSAFCFVLPIDVEPEA